MIGARLPIVFVAVGLLTSGVALASSLEREPALTASGRPDPQVLGVANAKASDAGSFGRLGRFSLDRAFAHVRRLAGRIGTRVRAHSGEKKASRYIARRFRSMGYRTHVNPFPVDGDKSRNVVARWPASARYGIVLGAHMDTVPGSPGANDNASGVAVLLETARLIAAREPSRWVKLVAFGSEEYGADGRHHVGSSDFVERLGARGRRRLAGMVSIDMIADGRPLLTGTSGIGPPVAARSLFRIITAKTNIGIRYITFCDCSDHGPFERAGAPATFLYSGEEPDYHSASDIPNNLIPRDLRRTGRAVRAFVADVDGRLVRRWRSRG
ncbi:MAG: M20/M25/M40 family metallo-hydrolase [Actinomycetota bacterium]|nr:M20/M25/M40 family metallo-hydrolase [Actinomycetota bacterium]